MLPPSLSELRRDKTVTLRRWRVLPRFTNEALLHFEYYVLCCVVFDAWVQWGKGIPCEADKRKAGETR